MKFIKIQTKESSFWIDVTTIKIVSITGLLVTIQFHEDKAGYPGETKEFLLIDAVAKKFIDDQIIMVLDKD